MINPCLAICNIFGHDAYALADFAHMHWFKGIDWTFDLSLSKEDFLRKMKILKDFEVRYHCFFYGIDLAYADHRSEHAMNIFTHLISLIHAAGRRHMTIHIGLGQGSDRELDWQKGVENLSKLVSFGSERGIIVSLENLTNIWSSKPDLFKALIQETGAGITFDIAHAYVCQKDKCKQYISHHLDRVYNAHIYHTENQQGHIAPKSLDDIIERLDLLKAASSCDWWVIELNHPEEILRTRDFLSGYIQAVYH